MVNVLDKNGDHPLYEALRHHTVSQIKQLQDSNKPGSEKVLPILYTLDIAWTLNL